MAPSMSAKAKGAKAKGTGAKGATPDRARIRFGAISLWMFAAMALVLGARAAEGRPVYAFDLLPFGLWWAGAAAFAIALKLGRYRGVPALPGLTLMLSGIGVWARARIVGSVQEAGWVDLVVYPFGFVWMILAWWMCRNGRARLLRPLAPLAYLLSLGVVGALLALGARFRGAMYGPGGMTPTELLKVLVPIALAGFFASREKLWKNRSLFRPPPGSLLVLGAATLALAALLVAQRDLGMGVLLGLTLTGVMVVATGRWSWAVGAGVPVAALAVVVPRVFEHGARRFEAWLNPFADPTGAGWQVLQGLSGLFAGGLAGTGLGGGRPDRLPIAGSDFIYAVYGEEMGFLGCVLLLALYGAILRQGFRAAERATDSFSRLLAAGISLLLAAQVGVNIAGVVTLLPVTGIPLPFVSLGGSSAWVTSLQLGLLMALSEPKTK